MSPVLDDVGWWRGIDPEATLLKHWLVTIDVDPSNGLAGYRRPNIYRWTRRAAERTCRRRQKENDKLVAAWARRGVDHPASQFLVVDAADDPRRGQVVWFWQKDPEEAK